MQAIILAGGFGTRLKPLVSDVPKPMAMVAGRPFLCWLLEYMAQQGVKQATLCVHHMAGSIRDYFGNCYASIDLSYSTETTPLGTGGAIRRVLAQCNHSHPVLICNGDSLVELDYRRMMQQYLAMERPLTMAACAVQNCSRYSQLETRDGLIEKFNLLGEEGPGLISAGFYIASPALFKQHTLPDVFSFERDFLVPNVPALKPAVYEGVEYFIDIGVPADYVRAGKEIPPLLQQKLAA